MMAFLDDTFSGGKRIVAGIHEQPQDDIGDQHEATVRRWKQAAALARRIGGIVGRTQQTGLGVEIGQDLALVESVVAGGDDIRARIEQSLGDIRRNAKTAGGVFAVHDGEIDGKLLAQFRQMILYRLASGPADHVTKKQHPHEDDPPNSTRPVSVSMASRR